MGGDDDAAGSTEPLGDWDDDEWFDDDSEEWWDDDYDFGKDWDGFEDDESGALGIISSVQPKKTVNKRHMWAAHMAGPFKEGLLSYAFLAIGFSLLLGPGVSLKARVGLCWVAIPGLMVAVPPGTGVVAFFWILVGVIVYRCKKWCADVVARIEAIESTIQVTQNPPPPRRDLLNTYSGEIGICVLLFYLVFLYQHSL